MIDRNLLEKKLKKIEEFLRELRSVRVEGLEEFRKDVVTRRFIERNIELAIEQMVDICKHLVSGLDLKEPETYSECFDILSAGGVVHPESAATFQTMARFRNILIHVYDGIDDAITYGIYTKRLGDFTLFVGQMREFLARKPDRP